MRDLSLAEKHGNGNTIILEDLFLRRDKDTKKRMHIKEETKKQKNRKDQMKEKKIDINVDYLDGKSLSSEQKSERIHNEINEVEGSEQDIVPVIGIARRIAMKTAWKEGSRADREHLRKRSPLGLLQTMVYEYMTSHLTKILIMYLVISVLVLTVPLFKALSNNKKGKSGKGGLGVFKSLYFLQPWCHTHMEVLSPVLDFATKSLLPPPLDSYITSDRPALLYLFLGMSVAMAPKVTFEYFFRPLDFLINYSPVLYWSVSYGIALMFHGMVHIFLMTIHWITASSWTVLRIVLRYTIWCQFIRRKFRYLFKSVKTILVTNIGLSPIVFQQNFFVFTISLGLVCTGFIIGGKRAWDRAFGPNSFLTVGTFIMCLVSLTMGVTAVVLLLLQILLPPTLESDKNEKQLQLQLELQNIHRREVSSLLILFPLMVAPSMNFSFNLLYMSEKKYLAALPLFDMFGPERLNFLFCLLAVISHLLLLRKTR